VAEEPETGTESTEGTEDESGTEETEEESSGTES
jgi:hypothetical protein